MMSLLAGWSKNIKAIDMSKKDLKFYKILSKYKDNFDNNGQLLKNWHN
jgi:hypothetical protein